jgi:hypothetical protein
VALPEPPVDQASRTEGIFPSSRVQALDSVGNRERLLAYLKPLEWLSANKTRKSIGEEGRGRLARVQTDWLALHLFDYLIEGAAVDLGRTRPECIEHLNGPITRMAPELSTDEVAEVAAHVFNSLRNKQNNYGEFEVPYWNNAESQLGTVSFNLIAITDTSGPESRHQLTEEGYLVTLGMLDLDSSMRERVLQRAGRYLLDTDRYEDATKQIKQARAAYIQFSTELRNYLAQIERDPASVNWLKTVVPKITAASEHIRARREENTRQRKVVAAKLEASDLDPVAEPVLRGILDLLDQLTTMRLNLLNELQNADSRYFAATDRAFIVRRRRASGTVAEVLSPGFGAFGAVAFDSLVDSIVAALFPPKVRAVFNLREYLSLVTAPPRECSPDEIENTDDVDATTGTTLTFSKELDAKIEALVHDTIRAQLARGGVVNLTSLLADPSIAPLADGPKTLAVIWCYRQLNRPDWKVESHDQIHNDLVIGQNLHFSAQDIVE